MKTLSAVALVSIVGLAGSIATAAHSTADPVPHHQGTGTPVLAPDLSQLKADAERARLRGIMDSRLVDGQAGGKFARLGSPGNTCIPGETKTLQAQAAIQLHSPKNVKKSNQYDREAIFSPEAGWVVSSAQQHVVTAGPPYSATLTMVPGNFSFASAQASQQILDSMFSFIGALDVPDVIKADLKAEIQEQVNNYTTYSSSLSSSHSMVKHNASVWGTGRTNLSTGHSWYEGDVAVTVKCAPAILSDANQMIAQLQSWTSQVVACYKGSATCGRG